MPYLFTFPNTHFAIVAEQILLAEQISASVMPLPGAIQSGCGLCLRVQDRVVVTSWKKLDEKKVKYAIFYMAEHGAAKVYKAVLGGQLGRLLPIFKEDVISVTGCGGKTTMLYELAKELRRESVLLTTTTMMQYPKEGQVDYAYTQEQKEELIQEDLREGRYFIARYDHEQKKCFSVPESDLEALAEKFPVTLIEADGSRSLPIKGYLDTEPCTPDYASLTIGILPVYSLGKQMNEQVVLRVKEFCDMTDIGMGDVIRSHHIGRWIADERGLFKNSLYRKVLFINQIESEEAWTAAVSIIEQIPDEFLRTLDRVILGSLHLGEYVVF